MEKLEHHPFLQIGESITGSRMIVGTFPIRALTQDQELDTSELLTAGILPFFYGSSSNYFWCWYQQFIDKQIDINDLASIISSLRINKIALSDVVLACNRKNTGNNDSDLKDIAWNLPLSNIIESRIDRILVTSKSTSGAMGWLINYILIPQGFSLDNEASHYLHNQILSKIAESQSGVSLIAKVLIKGSKTVSIVALPSPGSPYRALRHFGFKRGSLTSNSYLNEYLKASFEWLIESTD